MSCLPALSKAVRMRNMAFLSDFMVSLERHVTQLVDAKCAAMIQNLQRICSILLNKWFVTQLGIGRLESVFWSGINVVSKSYKLQHVEMSWCTGKVVC